MPAPIVLTAAQLRAPSGNKSKATTSAGVQIGSQTPGGHKIACKCSICTCGGHKCHIDKECITHYDPSLLRTNNQIDYNKKDAQPAQSAAPKRAYQPNGVKFDGKSLTKTDYNGQPGGKPASPIRPNGNNDTIHPSNDRYWSTENRDQYDDKGYVKRDGFKPKNSVAASVPFDGTTTNKADYRNWEGAKPASPYKAKNEIERGPEDRDFRSEAATRYVQHPYSKADAFVPKQRAANPAPFEGTTTAQKDYQAWKADPAQPFRPVNNQQAVPETRDFKSETRMQYGLKNASPAQSAAPKRSYQPSSAKFEGQSLTKTDYNGQAGKPASPIRPNGNNDTIHPSDERFWGTEHRDQYSDKGYVKRDGFKPKNSVAATAPFDGTTTNKADYRNWEGAKPASPYKAKNEIERGPEDRDFRSEAATRYVQHPYSKADAFVPKQRAANPAPFDGESRHHADFQPYVFAACPAAVLDKTQCVMDGHQVYTQSEGKWQSATAKA